MLDETIVQIFGPYLATIIGFALALLLVVHVLRRQQRQSASIAWLLAFLLAPFVFVPAYLLFAGRKVASRARSKRMLQASNRRDVQAIDGPSAEMEKIFRGYSLSPARAGNRIELIAGPETAYQELCALVDGAQRSIHLQTFVLARDRIGRDIVERLARRARDGIEVCLLVDALGSFGARFSLLGKLEEAGGQVGLFMPVLPLRRRWKADLRNHRKLVVFDGRTALTGGMNIGAHYMGPRASTSHWIDTMVKVEGPVVDDLARVFADDWEFTTDRRPPSIRQPLEPSGATQVAQVVPSGPDVEHDVLYDAILASLYKAKRRIWVVTPYFVPDVGLMRALTLQARLGTDVRIVLPNASDHWAADLARARFVRALRDAGARFLAHPDRMIHAKHLIVDDTYCMQGSTNLDMRSLYLNYELALFCYDPQTVATTAAWIERLMGECSDYEAESPGPVRRAFEDLCWLAAPLL